MDNRSLGDNLADMSSLASRVRAEAEVMRARTRRQGHVYVATGIAVAAYLSWSFVSVARFVDTEHLSGITGDIAVGRSLDLVDDATGEARAAAPQILRNAETAFVAAIPDIGKQLNESLRSKLRVSVQNAVEPYDRALVDELGKLPEAKRRIALFSSDPSEVARLFAELRERVRNRPEVRAAAATPPRELVALRDHLRHLREDVGLTPSARAERRFLQVALTKGSTPDVKTPEKK